MPTAPELQEAFRALYGREGRTYRAPGRVNLIGEHTDYNDGFVMPVALGFSAWAAAAPRGDRTVRVHSRNFSESRDFDLDERGPKPVRHWSDYIRGVAVELERSGLRLSGADLLISSDVPIGAGLSSSAAIEVAAGSALLDVSGRSIERPELAKLCQKAENEFVGMRCGVMDQFAACLGEPGKVLFLDCRSLSYRVLALPAGVRIVICDSMVKHELASGEYNRRRADCEAGMRVLRRELGWAKALRDVSLSQLEHSRPELDERVHRRCRHVISENARVRESAAALERGDLPALGRLMAESHRSLRDDYEVSCPELDKLVELASGVEGVFGARMTGGGFGGCAVSLVAEDRAEVFASEVSRGYEAAFGKKPAIYACGSVEARA